MHMHTPGRNVAATAILLLVACVLGRHTAAAAPPCSTDAGCTAALPSAVRDCYFSRCIANTSCAYAIRGSAGCPILLKLDNYTQPDDNDIDALAAACDPTAVDIPSGPAIPGNTTAGSACYIAVRLTVTLDTNDYASNVTAYAYTLGTLAVGVTFGNLSAGSDADLEAHAYLHPLGVYNTPTPTNATAHLVYPVDGLPSNDTDVYAVYVVGFAAFDRSLILDDAYVLRYDDDDSGATPAVPIEMPLNDVRVVSPAISALLSTPIRAGLRGAVSLEAVSGGPGSIVAPVSVDTHLIPYMTAAKTPAGGGMDVMQRSTVITQAAHVIANSSHEYAVNGTAQAYTVFVVSDTAIDGEAAAALRFQVTNPRAASVAASRAYFSRTTGLERTGTRHPCFATADDRIDIDYLHTTAGGLDAVSNCSLSTYYTQFVDAVSTAGGAALVDTAIDGGLANTTTAVTTTSLIDCADTDALLDVIFPGGARAGAAPALVPRQWQLSAVCTPTGATAYNIFTFTVILPRPTSLNATEKAALTTDYASSGIYANFLSITTPAAVEDPEDDVMVVELLTAVLSVAPPATFLTVSANGTIDSLDFATSVRDEETYLTYTGTAVTVLSGGADDGSTATALIARCASDAQYNASIDACELGDQLFTYTFVLDKALPKTHPCADEASIAAANDTAFGLDVAAGIALAVDSAAITVADVTVAAADVVGATTVFHLSATLTVVACTDMDFWDDDIDRSLVIDAPGWDAACTLDFATVAAAAGIAEPPQLCRHADVVDPIVEGLVLTTAVATFTPITPVVANATTEACNSTASASANATSNSTANATACNTTSSTSSSVTLEPTAFALETFTVRPVFDLDVDTGDNVTVSAVLVADTRIISITNISSPVVCNALSGGQCSTAAATTYRGCTHSSLCFIEAADGGLASLLSQPEKSAQATYGNEDLRNATVGEDGLSINDFLRVFLNATESDLEHYAIVLISTAADKLIATPTPGVTLAETQWLDFVYANTTGGARRVVRDMAPALSRRRGQIDAAGGFTVTYARNADVVSGTTTTTTGDDTESESAVEEDDDSSSSVSLAAIVVGSFLVGVLAIVVVVIRLGGRRAGRSAYRAAPSDIDESPRVSGAGWQGGAGVSVFGASVGVGTATNMGSPFANGGRPNARASSHRYSAANDDDEKW